MMVFGLASAASAEEKAIVIGLDYTNAKDARLRLSNPVRDAQEIAASFRRAKVDNVTLLTEPSESEFWNGLESYANSLTSDDVAVIFYAGHAVQYEGENFLVAGDGETLINLIDMIDQINQRAKATVLIVDACRNSPYDGIGSGSRSLRVSNGQATRSITTDVIAKDGGLAQVGDLRGLSTVVFFSTEPGNVAIDGEAGKGSPFAKVLAKEIRKRQSLDDLLRRTAVRVNKMTDGAQSPWRQGDIPFDVFLAGMKTMVIP